MAIFVLANSTFGWKRGIKRVSKIRISSNLYCWMEDFFTCGAFGAIANELHFVPGPMVHHTKPILLTEEESQDILHGNLFVFNHNFGRSFNLYGHISG